MAAFRGNLQLLDIGANHDWPLLVILLAGHGDRQRSRTARQAAIAKTGPNAVEIATSAASLPRAITVVLRPAIA
jgi:hypothetical protein